VRADGKSLGRKDAPWLTTFAVQARIRRNLVSTIFLRSRFIHHTCIDASEHLLPTMTSTTAIGRAFENHSMKFLNHHLNMCVRRVGGAGDEGIDLRGWWYVPASARRAAPVVPPAKYGGVRAGFVKGEVRDAMTRQEDSPGWGIMTDDQFGVDGWRRADTPEDLGSLDDEGGWRRLRVLAQCKAEGKQLGTRAVREMEGVMAHFHGASMSKSLQYMLPPLHATPYSRTSALNRPNADSQDARRNLAHISTTSQAGGWTENRHPPLLSCSPGRASAQTQRSEHGDRPHR